MPESEARLYCSICEQMTAHEKQHGEWVCEDYEAH